jgi:acetyl esterase/lipase
MRNAIAPLLALCLLATATTAAPAPAQQRLRERIAQRMEQRRGHDAPTSAALPAGTRVERDIAYGGDPKQRYDVYRPAGARPDAPILFMVHGGGWRRGDKRMPNVVEHKAAYWLDKGFVFVSVNYRMEPDADPLVQARDVAAALASVQRRAREWGADPAQTILMGHSAGAHLVALLGSDPAGLLRQAGARRPLGVVSLDSGALDVPALMGQPRLPQLYRDAFGSDPAYWRLVSPQQQLARGGLPMLLVCSSTRRAPTAPCDEARAFARHGAQLAVPMQVLPEAMSHGDINGELGLPSAYTRAVSDWIDRALMQVRR